MTKIRSAWKTLTREGFWSFWHRTKRLILHKKRRLVRKIFYPDFSSKFREEAKTYFLDNEQKYKLSIVIPVLGQHDITRLCLDKIIEKKKGEIEILIVDNGGDLELGLEYNFVKVLRPAKENTGVYPTFKTGMENTVGEIVLFIHSDLIIDEPSFDLYLRYVFAKYKKTGLVGFVGSDEITNTGGRGVGTTSNFLGKTYAYGSYHWIGTPASFWGEKFDGITDAVVIDGCSMALDRNVWNNIGYKKNYPPHHYYDRLISLQVLEAGYNIKVLGIACDHIGGQTAGKERKYFNTAEKWCKENKVSVINNNLGGIDWDASIHDEAKRLFLNEWRDQKHFIPKEI